MTISKASSIENLCAEDVAERLLEHIYKSYLVNVSIQMDTNLASFLQYTCKRTMTMNNK